MARSTRSAGIKQMLLKLERHIASTAAGTQAGLDLAGLALQSDSQRIVPVDESPLKNSSRTTGKGIGFAHEVSNTYGTYYAIYVHEDLNMRHATGKSAKFLETPLVQNKEEYMTIVGTAALGGKF